MQNLLFKITKIKMQVIDKEGSVSTSKEYNFIGGKSTAIKKLAKVSSLPSEVLYTLRKKDAAEHTYFDGTKLKVEIVKREEQPNDAA